MPPKKKAKSIIIDAIDDLEKDYDNDDEYELNICKVSLGKWRNIKHWKKVNQVFAEEYNVDPEALQQRSMSYVQLIPVENLETISPEWRECFIAETERYLTLNFNVWRIRPDDQITEVFEDYEQKKCRDDSIYRYMFRRMDSSYISKAIISYTKLSSRKPNCLFYLLKYMVSISPDVSNIYDIIDFIYTRQDISNTERIVYKKAFIFEIFPSFLERVMLRKRNKEWRTPFLYVFRMLVELNYENHDSEKRVLKMVIHLFKKVSIHRQYPKITTKYQDLKAFYSDLMDFQKSRHISSTIPDDVSIKSEDTDSEVLVQMFKDHISSDRDNESIVFHSLFLYVLAWIQYLDPNYELCFLVEYFNMSNHIDVPLKNENDTVTKIVEKPNFVVWENVQKKMDSFMLMNDIKNFLNVHFPNVFKTFFQQTKMEQMYFCKQIQMNFELIDGNCSLIQDSLKGLFSETREFPLFTFIDIYLSQIGNFIRLNKLNEALNLLLTFAHKVPKLFPPEETLYDPKIVPRIFPKEMAKISGRTREIQVRPLNLDNIVDVLVNFLIIILTKQLNDKKLFEISIEKLLILSQHNWPQYSPVADHCFKAFETSGIAIVGSFRDYIFQTSFIEEFSGLKHRCPKIKFFITLEKTELSNEIVNQILLTQIEKSIKELPTIFYLKFILNSFPIKDRI